MNHGVEASESVDLGSTRCTTADVGLDSTSLGLGEGAIEVGAEATAGQEVAQHVGWTTRISRLFSLKS